MTQIKTLMAKTPQELDEQVNAALREVWTRTREIRTAYHDGWLVAVLIYDAVEEPRPDQPEGKYL
jgi:hypothetical protein